MAVVLQHIEVLSRAIGQNYPLPGDFIDARYDDFGVDINRFMINGARLGEMRRLKLLESEVPRTKRPGAGSKFAPPRRHGSGYAFWYFVYFMCGMKYETAEERAEREAAEA